MDSRRDESLAAGVGESVESIMDSARREASAILHEADAHCARRLEEAQADAEQLRRRATRDVSELAAVRIERILALRRTITRDALQLAAAASDGGLTERRLRMLADVLAERADLVAREAEMPIAQGDGAQTPADGPLERRADGAAAADDADRAAAADDADRAAAADDADRAAAADDADRAAAAGDADRAAAAGDAEGAAAADDAEGAAASDDAEPAAPEGEVTEHSAGDRTAAADTAAAESDATAGTTGDASAADPDATAAAAAGGSGEATPDHPLEAALRGEGRDPTPVRAGPRRRRFVRRARGGPSRDVAGAASSAGGDVLRWARLTALQMAVAGSSREETEGRLLERFDIADPAVVLDDVFGTHA